MLLAFLSDKPSYPKLPEGLADDVGQLCFVVVACLLLWAWTRAESVRRSISGLTDPRVFAVLRIGFALMTLVCILNLEPYWRMLWSDEGIFTTEYAQDRLGRSALRGWTPDEGFLDPWAVACFLWNKPSLLYIWGSPTFMYGYIGVFFTILLMNAVGLFSRTTGVLSWLLLSGIYNRNALYWEGTDVVYRCFWLILLFARTGHAWSVDNWWRCRRLRKRGLLHEGEGPVPSGKQPIYRLVPGWTRYLFMLQLGLLYTSTGLAKTGGIWKNGDALYFALNMDHFYRFELATQYVSYWFGTTVFRVMTWATRWWEVCFPVVVLGMILKFGRDHRDEPWWRAQQATRWRVWLGRLALLGAYGGLYRIVWTAYPWSIKTPGGEPPESYPGLLLIHISFLGALPALAALWYALDRWRVVVHAAPRTIWKLRIPRVVITPDTLRRWLFGRRVWLTLGFVFHGFLIAFMNIGMFPFIMLMTYAAFIDGEEWAHMLDRTFAIMRRLRLGKLIPKNAATLVGPTHAPAQAPHRGGRVPDLLVLGLVGAAFYLLLLRGETPRPDWLADAGWAWLGSVAVICLVALVRPRHRRDEPEIIGRGPAVIPTAVGRAVALLAVLWHGSAITLHLFPSLPVLGQFRGQLRIHSGWLRGSATTQSWNMFAPNPPTANSFMITVVVEEDGDRWDLNNNSWSYRPNPWIINDRMRKMQRRMIGKGKWYLRYWGEFQCREWTLRTGEMPREIIVDKIVTRIPGPDLVKKKGPFNPRKLRPLRTHVQTHECKRGGALPVYMKERYGYEVTDEDRASADTKAESLARKYENRKKSWAKRRDWGGGPDAPAPPEKAALSTSARKSGS